MTMSHGINAFLKIDLDQLKAFSGFKKIFGFDLGSCFLSLASVISYLKSPISYLLKKLQKPILSPSKLLTFDNKTSMAAPIGHFQK